ncbi:uncharacterized protein BDR25DRAFT_358260 [Lindgomyces ingoldianus]|uniref:Uncharacterized protein n=1 Tax=Lindgomyces ingoldianus TaxID=673940 RepID=A0ACB6QM37_9PLEO|nr:uncharacterized protein BDR25DRAFT_358260 [Lindgomyces ingoldianus]KAF2468003.1 hypothetical protein BDR25DRAFT_358260 [Lindgomyces ingoldianus]
MALAEAHDIVLNPREVGYRGLLILIFADERGEDYAANIRRIAGMILILSHPSSLASTMMVINKDCRASAEVEFYDTYRQACRSPHGSQRPGSAVESCRSSPEHWYEIFSATLHRWRIDLLSEGQIPFVTIMVAHTCFTEDLLRRVLFLLIALTLVPSLATDGAHRPHDQSRNLTTPGLGPAYLISCKLGWGMIMRELMYYVLRSHRVYTWTSATWKNPKRIVESCSLCTCTVKGSFTSKIWSFPNPVVSRGDMINQIPQQMDMANLTVQLAVQLPTPRNKSKETLRRLRDFGKTNSYAPCSR